MNEHLAWLGFAYTVGIIALFLGIDLVASLSKLVQAITAHRNAQATSILHHCGQLDTGEEA